MEPIFTPLIHSSSQDTSLDPCVDAMAGQDAPQCRSELKYLIDEPTSHKIRALCQEHMAPDPHATGRSEPVYPVHSLYFDSENLLTYWNTVQRKRERFKLRVRFYDDEDSSPVFCEIKRKVGETTLKSRARVRRPAAKLILAGKVPDPALLDSRDPNNEQALRNFLSVMVQIDARPVLHLAYQREAYVAGEDGVTRLTMDRQVRSEMVSSCTLSTQMQNPFAPWGDAVILELKFSDPMPPLFSQVVRDYSLKVCSAAKYVQSINSADQHPPGSVTATS